MHCYCVLLVTIDGKQYLLVYAQLLSHPGTPFLTIKYDINCRFFIDILYLCERNSSVCLIY
ncbi:unnamed protein product [Nyctereutes procyonoides]|uniref:(raccoon dog) hypothetical protein n=1 Tax=Nyctereutes procyonoides TaxID=34880 RepID=A0A811XYL0_NYCPR|nr:unnamed protein product [Nyctereutes procyonoides]